MVRAVAARGRGAKNWTTRSQAGLIPPMALFTIGFLLGVAAMLTSLYLAHRLTHLEG